MLSHDRRSEIINVAIPWYAIHTAAEAVDRARQTVPPTLPFGFDGVADAFGGTYYGSRYQEEHLAGVVRILIAANTIREDVWKCIHSGHRRARDPDVHLRVVEQVRAATRTALALHNLYELLASTGVVLYDPARTICGVADGGLRVTGLGWLAGFDREPEDRWIPVVAATAFAAGGSLAELRAECLEVFR